MLPGVRAAVVVFAMRLAAFPPSARAAPTWRPGWRDAALGLGSRRTEMAPGARLTKLAGPPCPISAANRAVDVDRNRPARGLRWRLRDAAVVAAHRCRGPAGRRCGAGATAARVAVRDAPASSRSPRSGPRWWRRSSSATIRGSSGRQPADVRSCRRPRWLRPQRRRPGIEVPARIARARQPSRPGARRLPGQRLASRAARSPARRRPDRRRHHHRRRAGVHRRPSWAQRAAGHLRAGLQRACATLPPRSRRPAPGLVLGDTSRLDPAVEDDFKTTGLTHLTAVSGANLAILTGFVLLIARWCRAGPGSSAILCGLALVGFVILARPSPSVVRAATDGRDRSHGAGDRPDAGRRARAGRRDHVLVVLDPELAGDAGFALSVLATGGLLLLAPRWRDAMRRRGVPAGVAEALAIPAAAQVACAPVIVMLSGSVSLTSVPGESACRPGDRARDGARRGRDAGLGGLAAGRRVHGLGRPLAGVVAGAGRAVRRRRARGQRAMAGGYGRWRCCWPRSPSSPSWRSAIGSRAGWPPS